MKQEKPNDHKHKDDLKWIDQYPSYQQDWMKKAALQGDSKEKILKELDVLEQMM